MKYDSSLSPKMLCAASGTIMALDAYLVHRFSIEFKLMKEIPRYKQHLVLYLIDHYKLPVQVTQIFLSFSFVPTVAWLLNKEDYEALGWCRFFAFISLGQLVVIMVVGVTFPCIVRKVLEEPNHPNRADDDHNNDHDEEIPLSTLGRVERPGSEVSPTSEIRSITNSHISRSSEQGSMVRGSSASNNPVTDNGDGNSRPTGGS